MADIILVVTSDLGRRYEIEAVATKEKVDCVFAAYGEQLADMVKRFNPFLLIADFSTGDPDWMLKHLGDIKARRNEFPIIGVISGSLEADAMRLEKAGCDRIVNKKSLIEKLPSLIERYIR